MQHAENRSSKRYAYVIYVPFSDSPVTCARMCHKPSTLISTKGERYVAGSFKSRWSRAAGSDIRDIDRGAVVEDVRGDPAVDAERDCGGACVLRAPGLCDVTTGVDFGAAATIVKD